MKNFINNTINKIKNQCEDFRSLPQHDQNYHWAIAITVYYFNLQHFAWESSGMDLFPYTLSVAHLLTYIYHSFIILILPPIILICAIGYAAWLVVLATKLGYEWSVEVWRCLANHTVVSLHKYALRYSNGFMEKWVNDMEIAYVKDIYQRLEERFNLDGYFIKQEHPMARHRHATWWIKNDVDWFDETNPRLLRFKKQYPQIVQMKRKLILSEMEKSFIDPVAAETIAKLRKNRWLKHIAILEEEKMTKSAKELTALQMKKRVDEKNIKIEEEFKKMMESRSPEEKELTRLAMAEAVDQMQEADRKTVAHLKGVAQRSIAWRKEVEFKKSIGQKFDDVNPYSLKYHAKSSKKADWLAIINNERKTALAAEKNTFLSKLPIKFKKDKEAGIIHTKMNFNKTDTQMSFFERTVFDAQIPCSAEIRSILELYGFVMYILLFIYFALVLAVIFAGLQILNRGNSIDFEGEDMGMCNTDLPIKLKKEPKSRFFKVKPFWDEVKWKKRTEGYPALHCLVIHITDLVFKYRKSDFAKFRAGTGGEVYWVYLSKLEAIWTALPCIILVGVSLPSFTLALSLDEAHKPQNWLKVNGSQWFWVYEYGNFAEVGEEPTISILFSNIVQGEDLRDPALRLLEVDGIISLPVNRFTRLLVTSTDVIHSFAVPALGLKIDACPGRINSVTVLPTKVGIYYGQCSEICGVNHAFMPICVEVIPV